MSVFKSEMILKMVNQLTFLDFLILIEHFMLEEVEIKSAFVLTLFSLLDSFAVIKPLSFLT
jgi:hypothetical protein